jgi:hypothetical protein
MSATLNRGQIGESRSKLRAFAAGGAGPLLVTSPLEFFIRPLVARAAHMGDDPDDSN